MDLLKAEIEKKRKQLENANLLVSNIYIIYIKLYSISTYCIYIHTLYSKIVAIL